MTYVEWSVQASEDRVAIFDYLETDSRAAASRLDDRIEANVERLAGFPEIGRPGRIDGTRELVIAQTPYSRVHVPGGRSDDSAYSARRAALARRVLINTSSPTT